MTKLKDLQVLISVNETIKQTLKADLQYINKILINDKKEEKKLIREEKGLTVHGGKPVNRFDRDGNYLQTHSNMTRAAKWVARKKDRWPGDSIRNNISNACKGKAKTAYGYKWEFATREFMEERTLQRKKANLQL